MTTRVNRGLGVRGRYFKRGVSNWERILTGRGLNYLPDACAMLPEQWRARAGYTPERQLWLMVLADALLVLRQGDPRLIDDVEEWIAGAEAPMPFEILCHLLDLDPAYVRSWIRRVIVLFRASVETDPMTQRVIHHHQARAGAPKMAGDKEVV